MRKEKEQRVRTRSPRHDSLITEIHNAVSKATRFFSVELFIMSYRAGRIDGVYLSKDLNTVSSYKRRKFSLKTSFAILKKWTQKLKTYVVIFKSQNWEGRNEGVCSWGKGSPREFSYQNIYAAWIL